MGAMRVVADSLVDSGLMSIKSSYRKAPAQ
jgi:hypothetical protein